ncbi:MAG: hypothetical protein HC888_03980 [Candidatus Competibacteraceae bacterium]|nr:hypothetical protein [Candidatus Competibacteraceae bacterium]
MSGWTTPSREFVQCSMYEHLQTVFDNEKLHKYVEKMASFKDKMLDFNEDRCAREESDEHPEWHSYEVAYDDFRRDVWRHLMNCNLIGIGKHGKEIYFEGKASTLASMKTWLEDFAEERGCVARLEARNN